MALEMPPLTAWFAGRPAVLAFFEARVLDVPGRVRMVAAGANGQPAFATYLREGGGPFLAHAVQGVFLLLAAGRPTAYASFLAFTMWANLVHGLLMAAQAAMDLERYWSKFLTDVPFVLGLAIGIYLLRPRGEGGAGSPRGQVR